MKQIPVNRYTVGAVAVVLLVFGGDFLAPLMKVLGILSAPYVPAV